MAKATIVYFHAKDGGELCPRAEQNLHIGGIYAVDAWGIKKARATNAKDAAAPVLLGFLDSNQDGFPKQPVQPVLRYLPPT